MSWEDKEKEVPSLRENIFTSTDFVHISSFFIFTIDRTSSFLLRDARLFSVLFKIGSCSYLSVWKTAVNDNRWVRKRTGKRQNWRAPAFLRHHLSAVLPQRRYKFLEKNSVFRPLERSIICLAPAMTTLYHGKYATVPVCNYTCR